MSKYIDANAFAYIVASNGDADFINKVTRLMLDAPSIDIEPKRGEWINLQFDGALWECSSCGFITELISAPQILKFCPHCGADMRKETVDYKSVVLTCDDEGNWSMYGERKESE